MTDSELLEAASEAAHDAWWAAKQAQGFHVPEECPCRGGHDYRHGTCSTGCPHPDEGKTCSRCGFSILLDNGVYGICEKCHSDMRPYADLDEATKELDRAHVRAVHGVYAAELERLRVQEQRDRDVDTICHYRNLAIRLGAKSPDMLNAYDRRLCDTGVGDDACRETDDVWDENERLRAENAALHKLAEYAGHRSACAFLRLRGNNAVGTGPHDMLRFDCDCGFEAAKRNAERETP